MPITTDADPRFRVRLSRRRRPSSVEECARQVHELCAAWGNIHPCLRVWASFDDGYRIERCSRYDQILEYLRQSKNVWEDGRTPPEQPSYTKRFFNGFSERESADFIIEFALEGDAPNSVAGLDLRARFGAFAAEGPEPRAITRMKDLLLAAVRLFDPDWANMGTANIPGPMGDGGLAPVLGWMTYLSATLGAPSVPKPASVEPIDRLGWVVRDEPGVSGESVLALEPIDRLGWLITAQPELMHEDNPAHLLALAYARHALGARVLFDGPRVAPTAPEPAPAFSIQSLSSTTRRPESALLDHPSPWVRGESVNPLKPTSPLPAMCVPIRPDNIVDKTSVALLAIETPPLPFSGTQPSPEFIDSLTAKRAYPCESGADSLDETIALLPLPDEGAPPQAINRNRSETAAPKPRLSMNQYATLSAELRLEPGNWASILFKHGLKDIDAKREEDQAWRARFAADPSLIEEWNDLMAQHQRRSRQ